VIDRPEEPKQAHHESETGQLRVAIVGASTPFGREAYRSLSQWEKIVFTHAIDQHEVGKSMRELAGGRACNVCVEDKLGAALDREPADILVDFSHSPAALQHGLSAIKRGVVPILGANLSAPDIRELTAASTEANIPVLVVPYFSIGAVMLLDFCNHAARWLNDVEIVDANPDRRMQGPSVLARSFAEEIAAGWEYKELHQTGGVHTGDTRTWEDVPLHKVRLRGAAACQEVRFGKAGESLAIRFEWSDPAAIIEGLKLAILRAPGLKGVTVGLEKLLFSANDRHAHL